MGKFLRLVNGVPRQVDEGASVTIYDETYDVVGTVTTGTSIALPAGGTYQGDELEVRLNGVRLESVVDYNYVGAGPTRTQISMTFDLFAPDALRFRVDRSP